MGNPEDLAGLATSVTEFAVGNGLTIVPAVPEHDCGPEVCLGPDALDLPGFLALVSKLGGGVLYLQAVPFSPDTDQATAGNAGLAHLVKHRGHIGELSIAFAANGLVHFWEHQTAWYEEWQEVVGSRTSDQDWDVDETERPSAEEQARAASELADLILANPKFRAAPRSERQRLARMAIPSDADGLVRWDAVRQACDRAQKMAEERYDQLAARLDELAAELLASPEYGEASSALARKRAAERFLIPLADGFCPPPLVREELHARAQKLAKTARGSSKALF